MPRVLVNGVRFNTTVLPQRVKAGRGAALGGAPGTPIVFIHGLAASQAFWYLSGAQVLARLGDCLLYDLRAHGKTETPASGFGVTTMADDLLGLLDRLDLDEAHIVAHSFGGMIALLAALRQPERFRSLVLTDVRVRPLQESLEIPIRDIPAPIEEILANHGIALDRIEQTDDGVDYLRTVAKIQMHAGPEAEQVLRAIYNHPKLFRSAKNAERWVELTERASVIEDLKSAKAFAPADLKTLKLPMLITYGGNSTTKPSATALKTLCPHALVHEVPGVGHFFPMTAPKLFLRPAMAFLRAVNAGRPAVMSA